MLGIQFHLKQISWKMESERISFIFSYRFSLSLLKFSYVCGYLYIYLSTHTQDEFIILLCVYGHR